MKNKLLCDPRTGECFIPSLFLEIEINDDHAFSDIKELLFAGHYLTVNDVECIAGEENCKTLLHSID